MKILRRSKKAGEGFIQAYGNCPVARAFMRFRGNSLALISHLTIPAGTGQPTCAAVRRAGWGQTALPLCSSHAPNHRRAASSRTASCDPRRPIAIGPPFVCVGKHFSLWMRPPTWPLPASGFFSRHHVLWSVKPFCQVLFKSSFQSRHARLSSHVPGETELGSAGTQPNKG